MSEYDNVTTVSVDARTLFEAVGRKQNVEHFDLRSATLEDGEVVVEYDEPVGKCPACGGITVGTTAWNSAHDRTFVCRSDECAVEKHGNEVAREGGDK